MSITLIMAILVIALCGGKVLKWACRIILFAFINIFYILYLSVNSLKKLFLKGRRRIFLTEATQIKEFMFLHSPATGRTRLPKHQQGTKHFHGNLLLKVLGLPWRQQRHTLEPVWYQSNIKDLYEFIVDCTEIHLENIEVGGTDLIYEISKKVKILTSHIMLRTEFRCSHQNGILIAELLTQQQQIRGRSNWHSCISRFFLNRRLKVVDGRVERLLQEMIQPRVDYVAIARINSHGDDLLGKLLDEMHKKFGFINMTLIVNQCKKSLFAGDEATTHLITSTLTLLSRNPDWQDLVRTEINDLCLGDPPTSQHLRKFGLLNMVIKESLRLSPPVGMIERMVCEDIRLSDGVLIPNGALVCIPITAINYSEAIWGDDVRIFNPRRFADDASVEARRHFIPFSTGPQHCPAQYYAMMKAKIILVMFISKYRFI